MIDHLITLLFLIVFLVVIVRWRFFDVPEIPRWYLAIIFLLKFMAGVTLAFLFRKYFNGGDTYQYFESACRLYELALDNPRAFLQVMAGRQHPELNAFYDSLPLWKSHSLFDFDVQTIIRLNALIRFVSFGIYNVHVLFFSFFSLVGIMAMYRMMRRAVWENRQWLFAGLFLFPSLMFWTSGILKEGVLILGMGLLLYGLHLYLRTGNRIRSSLLYLLIGLMVMLLVKIYVLILLLPGLLSLILAKRSSKNILVKFAVTHLVYFLIVFNLHHLLTAFNAVELLHEKQHHSVVFAQYMQSRSIIYPPAIEPSVASIIRQLPAAVFSALKHPMITQAHNPFAFLAAIENLVFIGCLVLSLVFARKIKREWLGLFMLALSFAVLLYALIGFTTTTAGSLVRYKVPALPFLILIITMLNDRRKMCRMFGSRKAAAG